MAKIKIGLYGINGHQVHNVLVNHPLGECVAVAGIEPELIPQPLRTRKGFTFADDLDALLADKRIELISLCSPHRRQQAQQAIQCLEAGKHVYAEKPCAMTEQDLDAILAAVENTGMEFHEMAGTAFTQPYYKMRQLVQSGTIGSVVQVFAQKSYPYHDRRPQDEDRDGGLLLQAGVHALRFIEHVAGTRVQEISAIETQNGNPGKGNLRMATSMMMRLENGGVASVICNYLNPPAFPTWGNECLRIFGTQGFIEAIDGGMKTRLVLNDQDCGALDIDRGSVDYLDLILNTLQGNGRMPFTLEEEIHPTRILIRAKMDADARGLQVMEDL
ncbi:MAG: Gfo/Idh/MocA family oxidoreductase [Anaerolineae bacterium]|nr:Gfo/Idh/MocA family oxidoreductase [Anaerolineae bacterium]